MAWEALTKRQDENEALIPDAQRYREQWVQDVHELILKIESYLDPLRQDGRVLCHRDFLEVAEEGLGNYRIERLGLEFRQIPGQVELVPKSALVRGIRLPNGAWKTGVSGRVNLSYGALTVPLTRVQDVWNIAIGADIKPLDDTRFQVAVSELLGLE